MHSVVVKSSKGTSPTQQPDCIGSVPPCSSRNKTPPTVGVNCTSTEVIIGLYYYLHSVKIAISIIMKYYIFMKINAYLPRDPFRLNGGGLSYFLIVNYSRFGSGYT